MTLPIEMRRGTMIILAMYFLALIPFANTAFMSSIRTVLPESALSTVHITGILLLCTTGISIALIMMSHPYAPYVSMVMPILKGLEKIKILFNYEYESLMPVITLLSLSLTWLLAAFLVRHVIHIEQQISMTKTK